MMPLRCRRPSKRSRGNLLNCAWNRKIRSYTLQSNFTLRATFSPNVPHCTSIFLYVIITTRQNGVFLGQNDVWQKLAPQVEEFLKSTGIWYIGFQIGISYYITSSMKCLYSLFCSYGTYGMKEHAKHTTGTAKHMRCSSNNIIVTDAYVLDNFHNFHNYLITGSGNTKSGVRREQWFHFVSMKTC